MQQFEGIVLEVPQRFKFCTLSEILQLVTFREIGTGVHRPVTSLAAHPPSKKRKLCLKKTCDEKKLKSYSRTRFLPSTANRSFSRNLQKKANAVI